MRRPLAIDLFCGLGGWTDGLLAEGYRVVGFDNERHVYGEARYPAQLVIQDVLTMHGRQLKDAALIVASPPCQEYSYMAMPWSRAKKIAEEYRSGVRDVANLTRLFDACFRIQREASEAAGHLVPLVVENVCGAQKWVGRAGFHFGSFYLWGDIPALMPTTRRKGMKGSVGTINGSGKHREQSSRDRGEKVAGFRFDGSGGSFQSAAVKEVRQISESWRMKHYEDTEKMAIAGDGVKQGGDWFNAEQPSISRQCGSKSSARKAASAHIARIPLDLARWVGKAWKPV